MDRAWCISSLMLIGHRLAEHDYFDRAPVLEMVKDLRNRVAHGNRFTIRKPSELAQWPAHNRHASCRTAEPLEMTAELAVEILVDVLDANAWAAVDLPAVADEVANVIAHPVVLVHCPPGSESLLPGEQVVRL